MNTEKKRKNEETQTAEKVQSAGDNNREWDGCRVA
jgi:hypothetical protein